MLKVRGHGFSCTTDGEERFGYNRTIKGNSQGKVTRSQGLMQDINSTCPVFCHSSCLINQCTEPGTTYKPRERKWLKTIHSSSDERRPAHCASGINCQYGQASASVQRGAEKQTRKRPQLACSRIAIWTNAMETIVPRCTPGTQDREALRRRGRAPRASLVAHQGTQT